MPNPQSQSFSQSYGSILPTSLTYVVLWARGCSPWRHDAVMGTGRGANKPLLQLFKGNGEHAGHLDDKVPCPPINPSSKQLDFKVKDF